MTAEPSRRIELVFHQGCPNVEAARGLLARALTEAGLPSIWREWRTDADDTPVERRGLGSPTILIDGVDVASRMVMLLVLKSCWLETDWDDNGQR